MKFTTLLEVIIKDQMEFQKQIAEDSGLVGIEYNAAVLGVVNDFKKIKTREDLMSVLDDYGYDEDEAVRYILDFLLEEDVEA